ncbi:hypothetical protein J2S70_001048 [Trueperella bonasi]|uniref:Uncharacterized protein n=1 Tax=Trueperella bonasi TaxID=312286 RepID=A0ABT9NGD4_9ACTO|nr:hypothetical protein [Trueperella bonasi]MDP9806466.1 hypothetical protein [Trueperella bonasi]
MSNKPDLDQTQNDSYEPSDELVSLTNSEDLGVALDGLGDGFLFEYETKSDDSEILRFEDIPEFQFENIESVISKVANASTLTGNGITLYQSLKGLYALAPETQMLLGTGAKLSTKGGAKIGSVMKNGKIIAQARFVPVSLAGVGAIMGEIGPAVAMIVIQRQIDRIAEQNQRNIAISKQILDEARRERENEFQGHQDSLSNALKEVVEIGGMTDTTWDQVRASDPKINEFRRRYNKDIDSHVSKIREFQEEKLCDYLLDNGEKIIKDAYAQIDSLVLYARYRVLRALRAKQLAPHDPSEALHYEKLTRETPNELDDYLDEIRELTVSLYRELDHIVRLDGRRTFKDPLKKDRRRVKERAEGLLLALEPLVEKLSPKHASVNIPEIVCSPEEMDIESYLKILRWSLDADEIVEVIAFVNESDLNLKIDGFRSAVGKVSGVLKLPKLDFAGNFVVLTNERLLVAEAKKFMQTGKFSHKIPRDDVKYVRPRANNKDGNQPKIRLTCTNEDIDLVFGNEVDSDQLDAFEGLLLEIPTESELPTPIESSESVQDQG